VSAASACACRRTGFGDGSPALRENRKLPRKGKGLPGYWAVLFVRAVVQHPAGCAASSPLPLFEEIHGDGAIAFTENRTLGIRNGHSFRGRNPTAHTLACLRFADPVTETVARLATGSGGLTPGRAGFAPAGRRIDISWSHRKSSNPNRPAEPGRTILPTPCTVSMAPGFAGLRSSPGALPRSPPVSTKGSGRKRGASRARSTPKAWSE
jgi:hypothetical protein